MRKFFLAIALAGFTQLSHATSPCPLGAPPDCPNEFAEHLLAMSDEIVRQCSLVDPDHPKRFAELRNKWFESWHLDYAHLRASETYLAHVKDMESKPAQPDKVKLLEACKYWLDHPDEK